MRIMTTMLVMATLTSLAYVGCTSEDEELASDYADFSETDISVCDPASVSFSTTITNPFHPLPVGAQIVLEGKDDGTLVRVEIDVLDEVEEIAGITTRVVTETEYENGELIEVSRNFFAQAEDGTVCYFGEDVDDYSGGEIVGHGGAWRAGENGAKPGIIMPADPSAGQKFYQEYAAGVAEDRSAITALGEVVTTPAGEFADTVRCFDWNPLEGESGDEKFYARGLGLIVDEVAVLISFSGFAE